MRRLGLMRAPHPALAAGAVGSALVALGATSPRFSHRTSWGWAPVDRLGGAIPPATSGWLVVVGLVLMLGAWWSVRPWQHGGVQRPRVVLVVWAAPLLLVPPVLTSDPFAYADIAWLAHVGADLDTSTLASRGGPFAGAVDPFWAGAAVPYPPGAVAGAHLATAATGYHAWWGIVGQRVVALVGVALVALALPSVSRSLRADPAWVWWMALLNPFTVVHLVGGAHNDSLMVGLVVVGLAVALAPSPASRTVRLVLAAVLVGLAATIKPQALVTLPAVAALVAGGRAATGARGLRRYPVGAVLGAGAVAVGVAALVHVVAGRSLAWVEAVTANGELPSLGPVLIVTELGERVLMLAAGDARSLAGISVTVVTLAAVAALHLVGRLGPVEVAGWSALLVALGTAVLAPWHLALGVALLAFGAARRRPYLIGSIALSGYLVTSAVISTLGWTGLACLTVGVVVAAALTATEWVRGRRRHPDDAVEGARAST